MTHHERAAALDQFRAEGRSPQWIFGWWRHQMRLLSQANDPVFPLPDTDDDDPTLDDETRMWLVLDGD